jgi:probable rRNA maturation factor
VGDPRTGGPQGASLPDGVEVGGPALAALPPVDRAWLAEALACVLATAGIRLARLAVEVVHDGRMRELHARHMGLDSTTDVLTFAQNQAGEPVDADVAVCLDEAARRGQGTAHGTRGELLLYALHGLLHAAGHDDRDDASYARMHAEEDRILEAAGFGRIFEGGAP